MKQFSNYILLPATYLLAVILEAHISVFGQAVPSFDPAFQPVITRPGGAVSAVAVQPDTKVIVAGGFNAINGIARNGLARVNADGSVDPTFDAGAICCGRATSTELMAPISAMTLQPDGKILIGGSFSSINGTPRVGLARLNANGTLDNTFNPGSGLVEGPVSANNPAVVTLVLQSDGKILVGGYFTAINGVARNGLARLNPDGSVDTTFDPGFGVSINDPTDAGRIASVAVLSNGQIMVGGAFRSFNFVPRDGLVRLDANGSVDLTWGPAIGLQGGVPSIDGMLVQADGKIVISGAFEVINNELRLGLARLTAAGEVDPGFNPDVDTGNGESYTLLGVQGDTRMIAFHQFNDASGTFQRALARVNADGTFDPTYQVLLYPGEGNRFVLSDFAFAPNGSVLVGGNFAVDQAGTQLGIAQLSASGAVNSTFHPRFELAELFAYVNRVAAQADGRVLIGGSFRLINGAERPLLARLNRDGSLDTTFAPVLETTDPRNAVGALLAQPDGMILVGGGFTKVNGITRNGLARLNPDGTLDPTFDPGPGAGEGGGVSAVAVQPDGKVLVAGSFTEFNRVQVPWMARLLTNGTVDLTFSPGFSDSCATCITPNIHSIGVLSNGTVMVSGDFNRVEAFMFNGLVRLRPTGTADTALIPPITAEEQVIGMAVGADNRTTVAIITPDPTGAGSRARLLRVNPDGKIDPEFNPDIIEGDASASFPVAAMVQDIGGRLVLAGQFTKIGGVAREGVARLNRDGTLDTTFDAGPGFQTGVFAPTGQAGPLVKSMAWQPDGGIVVGGSFARVNNQLRLGLVRFQADVPPPITDGQLRLSSPHLDGNGVFSMRVAGEIGRAYKVESSTDLRTWSDVGTVTGTDAPASFTDSAAPGQRHRFYRVSPR
jgi:uncharacterized delta-60 repeat protein